MKHVLVVTGVESGLSLSGFLAARLGLHAAEAESWVRAGSVSLDGKRQRQPDVRVVGGQQVIARAPQKPASTEELGATHIAYRDSELAIVDKPAGLASMPLRQGGPSLQDELPVMLGSEARLLHRLDQETSGLLLCAVSVGARRVLADAVAEHRLLRGYLAVVRGELAQPELVLRSRLAVRAGRSKSSQDLRARPAVTRIRPLRHLPDRTLVEARLETGRSHQIRAQLSEAGWPIFGDQRYGGPTAPRLALHAHRLGLVSPSGRWVDVHSPLPAEIRSLLD